MGNRYTSSLRWREFATRADTYNEAKTSYWIQLFQPTAKAVDNKHITSSRGREFATRADTYNEAKTSYWIQLFHPTAKAMSNRYTSSLRWREFATRADTYNEIETPYWKIILLKTKAVGNRYHFIFIYCNIFQVLPLKNNLCTTSSVSKELNP